MGNRRTRFFGSRGTIEGDGSVLRLFDFTTGQPTTVDTAGDAGGVFTSGDEGLVRAFLDAVATGDKTKVWSSVEDSLKSLEIIWEAERSRRAAG